MSLSSSSTIVMSRAASRTATYAFPLGGSFQDSCRFIAPSFRIGVRGVRIEMLRDERNRGRLNPK